MLKPLANNVLLILNNNNDNQLIYLPTTTNKYQVVAFGEQVTSLKEKNIVIINENKTTKFDYNNQTYYIVSIEDVLLVLED